MIEDHISLHRRHKLGETVDEFACSGSDGQLKRKRITTASISIKLGNSPEPVRRRTTYPVIAGRGDMDIDKPKIIQTDSEEARINKEVVDMEVDEEVSYIIYRLTLWLLTLLSHKVGF